MKKFVHAIIVIILSVALNGCSFMNLGSSRKTNMYNKPTAEKATGHDSSRILVNIKDVGQQLDDSLYNKEKYVIYSIGIGNLLNKKVPGTLTAMFPYTSKDISTGITTPQTFNGHFKDPFHPIFICLIY